MLTFACEGKIAKCANGCGEKNCLNPMEFNQGEKHQGGHHCHHGGHHLHQREHHRHQGGRNRH